MNLARTAEGGTQFRKRQQNTASESNPVHFSVNGISADVVLIAPDNHPLRLRRRKPAQDSRLSSFDTYSLRN
jgi:hypothetical protein